MSEDLKTTIKFYSSRDPHGYMSNFARYEVKMGSKTYETSEHCYQSQKFAGTKYEEQVRFAKGPMAAASLGRNRSLPLRPDWESVKDNVMREVVEAKFRQHDDIRQQLLATGDAVLIEDTSSSGDAYWGKVNGQGKNMLGVILMEVREKLRHEEIDKLEKPLGWHELKDKHGREQARSLVAAKLRSFAEALESGSWPDVYDAEIEYPGEKVCDQRLMETITVTLSHPWPG
jgi:hypothetical protein